MLVKGTMICILFLVRSVKFHARCWNRNLPSWLPHWQLNKQFNYANDVFSVVTIDDPEESGVMTHHNCPRAVHSVNHAFVNINN